MAYSRTYTIDAGPTGDTVKAAIATKLDGDLTNAYTYLNAHDVATTNVHGLGTAYVVGTTTAQTLTNKTISSPTITGGTIENPTLTGTVDASGATISSPTITGGTATNMTLVTPTSLGVTWTDYSSTSTVAGWAAGYTASIQYAVVGKIVYVFYSILGTTAAATASFTVPTASSTASYVAFGYVMDSALAPLGSYGLIGIDGTTVNLYFETTLVGGGWSNDDVQQKYCYGSFFYPIA